MCGIFIYLKKHGYKSSISKGQLYDAFMRTQSRGPDKSSFLELSDYGVCLGFHRLAINDLTVHEDQHLYLKTKKNRFMFFAMEKFITLNICVRNIISN